MLGVQRPNVEENERIRCMIYPEDSLKVFWDSILSIVLLATCLLTPFTLAFSEELSDVYWYNMLNYIIDLFFAFDILINFNTAFYREDYEIETNRKAISCNYLRGWFLIDFFSVIPLDLMIKETAEAT